MTTGPRYERRVLRIADLVLDPKNPRLPVEAHNSQQAALRLAEQRAAKILKLARDIVTRGSLDPLSGVGVIADAQRPGTYKVVEGNRRVLALKALDSPELITPALSAADRRKLARLAREFATRPIDEVECTVFATERDVEEWVLLRHTGENDGAGIVRWQAAEQYRFQARRTGRVRPAIQVLDFVDQHGSLSDEAATSTRRIITTVERLLRSPDVRKRLGFDIRDDRVVALYDRARTVRVLSRIVDDMKTGRINVGHVYTKDRALNYASSVIALTCDEREKPLATPAFLTDWTAAPAENPSPRSPRRRRRHKRDAVRVTVIPRNTQIQITITRIERIFTELTHLDAERFTNACSVLLRVFVELCVDELLYARRVLDESRIKNDPLSRRLKTAAAYLHEQDAIAHPLKQAIDKVADGHRSVIGVSMPTFNMYVHNQYVFPSPRDLYAAWDELEPFVEALWRELSPTES